MEIPPINLKAIVLVHWLLTVWGCLVQWMPISFSWSNFSILAVGLWAIAQRDSIDAVLMFLIGMVVTILTDIIHFGVYYPIFDTVPGVRTDVFRFSTGMAILNLLLKPVSCFFVYQMYRERGGEYNVNFGFWPFSAGFPSVSRNREAYQSIDQQDESSNQANPFNQAQDGKPAVRAY
ncbi:type-1 angiotensin II receptor-associated [Solea senegalensis]|uniref:Type-1 angiotensin II receptor-associated n=1 Tax=Solea senegalensis TaxID=28829 RepID=A0AAV6QP50_SOLSE|nr:type-1 angiotensin II receptor-associated protein isoform X1 [Solea senegalensis]KAG7494064.1 type-1 angiotensin II receptor-associated [Solea senegalensis]